MWPGDDPETGEGTLCEAKLEQLQEVSAWIEQYKIFWNTKLDDLDQFLKNTE